MEKSIFVVEKKHSCCWLSVGCCLLKENSFAAKISKHLLEKGAGSNPVDTTRIGKGTGAVSRKPGKIWGLYPESRERYCIPKRLERDFFTVETRERDCIPKRLERDFFTVEKKRKGKDTDRRLTKKVSRNPSLPGRLPYLSLPVSFRGKPFPAFGIQSPYLYRYG